MKVPLVSLLPHWPALGGSPKSGVLNVQTFGDAGELWSDLVSLNLSYSNEESGSRNQVHKPIFD